jgi:excisionase family DNA binding protein
MSLVPQPPENTDDLLTVKQAADRCGLSPVTIRRYINRGILPAKRYGPRLWRIRAGDLDKIATPGPASSDEN